METAHKYEELEKFISENFSTTTNMNDRLHTRDILDIFNRNKSYSVTVEWLKYSKL